jgi:phosphoribosylamine--glycine ligase/phosphoribosylformylglycinamidine cyclo-ligase
MTANVLVVGRGGREHAIAWKLAQSPRVAKVFVAPGNGGTASAGNPIENVPITEDKITNLIEFAAANDVTLTVIGPEVPLVDGIVDCFEEAGLRCFGPVKAAARIEGSKSFAKELMRQLGIPTAEHRVFTGYEEAAAYLRSNGPEVVVKAAGLAAGKGVIVPESMADADRALRRIMVDREFGAAGDEVIIEDRLVGQEASLLAFCDGTTVIPMPPAQDHKPVHDGDLGPNTGGMGAYAPTPLLDATTVDDVVEQAMLPVIREMARSGDPYVGVLYAGLMLTADGFRVLEFNCRFGDPETQVLLPLLDTDLYEILEACVEGTLDQIPIRWKPAVAATVVAASEGYPGAYVKGREISGIAEAESVPGVTVFHAGTRRGETLVTDGGRVLAVTGVHQNLAMALMCAYHGIEHISFEGMHFRGDIGARSVEPRPPQGTAPTLVPRGMTYADAGVDISAGAQAVELMKKEVRSTYGPEVLAGIGAFGGMFDASGLGDDAVLVASTDGVGTKTKIATALGRYNTVGRDIVNHCVNDILVQGAHPLFFLDYLATGSLDPKIMSAVVGGMAAACRDAGCALLGGETAEMPGVYVSGELDVVGTMVGVVPRDDIIDGSAIVPGDVVIGIPSSGLHTNGYSLARRVFRNWDLTERIAALGTTLGEALLVPHRSYLKEITGLRDAGATIHSLVHVTGGGLVDNPARVLPAGTAMRLHTESWAVPPIFSLIRSQGNVADAEMYRAFNMGLGMLVVVPATEAAMALEVLGAESLRVGEIVARDESAVELVP